MNVKISRFKISLKDPLTRKVWDATLRAEEHVAKWLAWKRGEDTVSKNVKLEHLDITTQEEVLDWLENIGDDIDNCTITLDVIPSSDTRNMRYWLHTKEKVEGKANPKVVAQIGSKGKITRPVIIDLDRDTLVEGRHRLSAGLKYALDVPVVMLRSL